MITEGLHEKFTVRRTDPEAQARHQDCDHFVLDLTHDAAARVAVMAYAIEVRPKNPDLATALRRQVDHIIREQSIRSELSE